MDVAGHVVLVGGGHAAAAFVNTLRRAGYDGRISLISDETVVPYHRPPLSKKYLAQSLPVTQILIRSSAWYDEQKVELHLGQRVERIDRDSREVVLADGQRIGYDRLVLVTGSRARPLPAELGGELRGVCLMRSLADADALAPQLHAGRRMLVVGGGYIGLEAAAVASAKGLAVTLIEGAPRILQRVAASATSDYFRQLHRSHGVTIKEGVSLHALRGAGQVDAAELSDGSRLHVDVVLAGIGVLPNVELAQQAGLKVDNGIVVDAWCRTSDAHILAAGDCTSFEWRGQRIRLESVQNANDQGAAAAHAILGDDKPYKALPWFWSDQYDIKLQIAGLNLGHDDVLVRPGKTPTSQSVWYFAGTQLLAVDAMNDAAAFVTAKKLLERGASVPKEAVLDRSAEFKTWLV
ncbi:MAG: FAD-dependent oxidoreductase [Rubrivivax sp.]